MSNAEEIQLQQQLDELVTQTAQVNDPSSIPSDDDDDRGDSKGIHDNDEDGE